MANDEEVKQEVYYIPDNFEDAGGVLGGHFTQRNAIELLVLCGPLAYLELKLLRFSIETNIIIMMLTLIPLAALCAFGINGESLSQILVAFIRYRRKRRKLSYFEFSDSTAESAVEKKFTFDSFLDSVTSKGLKGTMEDIKSAKEHRKADGTEGEEADADEAKPHKKSKKKATAQPRHKDGHHSQPGHKAPPAAHGKAGMMNSALKEKLLKKLELGEDDEY